jgi:tRNA(Ile)-lysidine synthase
VKSDLERALVRAIEGTGLIAPGDRIGVAVSGGADSVAMLRLLDAARRQIGITLIVVHFDHCLRAESAEDASFVQELARSRGFPYIIECANVGAVAAREKRNIEDTARRLRYDFFARVVSKERATKIAVAHTMDDQAETVLARLLRGCGPSGLAGIHPRMGVVVRPLLGFRRAALRDYLRQIGQEWREDRTNLDQSRQRARIRQGLLPLLERDYSPDTVEHLANLAQLSAEQEQFWSALVEDRFAALAARRGSSVLIDVSKLLSPLELASREDVQIGDPLRSLTERMIRRLYQEVRGDLLKLTSVHVADVLHLASGSESGRQIDLPGGVIVTRIFRELVFFQKCRN